MPILPAALISVTTMLAQRALGHAIAAHKATTLLGAA